ncbi:hypothetical protein GOP47_0007219 [Adiantum capillus-veneris]|uniref:Cationic amino acid transporter C-terminal domain-containing protein n=1 Tax=Adiantum capillus-veneris TaxID=13818 RepID=A0A9D4ZLP6_ADICA|nr:hypothetical protein GOP47_0007219 [Adiantum capillus-veneris]
MLRKLRHRFPGKEDFLPEPSFESFHSYGHALLATPQRFRNRLLARSTDFLETHDVKAQSHHDMKKTLNWWDLMWFGVGAIIGAGIFVLTGQEANQEVGPAVILSYVVAGISAMLSVFCYTEFAIEIPVAGGSFAYLRVELGDFVAFIAAGNIILEYVITGAAVSRSWTSYFTTLCNRDNADDFRIQTNLVKDFSLLDPIAVVILLVAGAVATWSTRITSRLNWIASLANMGILLFVIIAGLTQANPSNMTPFLPFGVRGVFKAASVLFFAYLGFDAVATMAEETKNPGKDIPLGLIGSMILATIFYCLMALTLSLMQTFTEIDPNAAFPLAFARRAGWNWARFIVALGALKGMTTVLLVNSVGQARYVTHIARTHMIPPWFAHVNSTTGTPIRATVVMLLASAVLAFFSSLGVLSNLLSISTLFIFMLVAIALLVRRYYVAGETTVWQLRRFQAFVLMIVLSSAATAYYWAVSDDWLAYTITLPIWFLSTLCLALFVPQVRRPQVWGTPLVPWLPSISIAMNIFLLGSIDHLSFARFAVWTLIILVYYLFFGLHASYDTAVNTKESMSERGQFQHLEAQPSVVKPTVEPLQSEAVAGSNAKRLIQSNKKTLTSKSRKHQ